MRGICLLSALLTAVLLQAPPAVDAQTFDESIAKARRILTEIEQLIDRILARQAAANAPRSADWKELFDGSSLAGWKVTDFGGGGEVRVEKAFRGGPAAIVVNAGVTLSGFHHTGDVPKTNYEVSLETMKIDGQDFLCGLTFPVAESHASLILGGWGGGVVGISSIDGSDASENPTTSFRSFPKDRWYRVRMRVTPDKLETWLDDEKIIDQDIRGKRISLRPGDISRSRPLGISTFQTAAAFRNIRIRNLAGVKK